MKMCTSRVAICDDDKTLNNWDVRAAVTVGNDRSQLIVRIPIIIVVIPIITVLRIAVFYYYYKYIIIVYPSAAYARSIIACYPVDPTTMLNLAI